MNFQCGVIPDPLGAQPCPRSFPRRRRWGSGPGCLESICSWCCLDPVGPHPLAFATADPAGPAAPPFRSCLEPVLLLHWRGRGGEAGQLCAPVPTNFYPDCMSSYFICLYDKCNFRIKTISHFLT